MQVPCMLARTGFSTCARHPCPALPISDDSFYQTPYRAEHVARLHGLTDISQASQYIVYTVLIQRCLQLRRTVELFHPVLLSRLKLHSEQTSWRWQCVPGKLFVLLLTDRLVITSQLCRRSAGLSRTKYNGWTGSSVPRSLLAAYSRLFSISPHGCEAYTPSGHFFSCV